MATVWMCAKGWHAVFGNGSMVKEEEGVYLFERVVSAIAINICCADDAVEGTFVGCWD